MHGKLRRRSWLAHRLDIQHPKRLRNARLVLAASKLGNIKAPLYSASGFREYWLVDVPAQVVEVSRDPGPDQYQQRTRYGIGETITLEAFPDVQIEIAKLF